MITNRCSIHTGHHFDLQPQQRKLLLKILFTEVKKNAPSFALANEYLLRYFSFWLVTRANVPKTAQCWVECSFSFCLNGVYNFDDHVNLVLYSAVQICDFLVYCTSIGNLNENSNNNTIIINEMTAILDKSVTFSYQIIAC